VTGARMVDVALVCAGWQQLAALLMKTTEFLLSTQALSTNYTET